MNVAGPVRTAVAVSPHLDDAVFSAGGTLRVLVRAGWAVRVVTCFTASVRDPNPFALSTQLDKGLSADVDYPAVRRAEDRAAQRVLGALPPLHLPFPEAPHRGYDSVARLFGRLRGDDDVCRALAPYLARCLEGADLVLAPQAIGAHVDHRVVARTVAAVAASERIAWWRDAPYVLREPDAAMDPAIAVGPHSAEVAIDIGAVADVKAAAAACYTTQLGFQFGGAEAVGPVLTRLAGSEAARAGGWAGQVETLWAGEQARRLLTTEERKSTPGQQTDGLPVS